LLSIIEPESEISYAYKKKTSKKSKSEIVDGTNKQTLSNIKISIQL